MGDIPTKAGSALLADAPFGTYQPGIFRSFCMQAGSRMPPTWAGIRVCRLLRSLVRRTTRGPVDAVVLGQRMRLHPSGNASEKRLLISPQFFDAVELAYLAQAITPNFAFVDIGANVGAYTIFMARHAGPDVKLLAVEPHPEALRRLRCNLVLNGISTDVVAPVAISDSDEQIVLHLDRSNNGGTSAKFESVGRPSLKSLSVPARGLLELLAERSFHHIDALKIDIEGTEDVVLAAFFQSAPSALHPHLIIIEDNQTQWTIDLFAIFRTHGYVRLPLQCKSAVFEKSAER